MQAALCSIRIIKKVPDLAEIFINAAAALLKEKHHGVLITGVQLCTDVCKNSSEALEHFKKVSYMPEFFFSIVLNCPLIRYFRIETIYFRHVVLCSHHYIKTTYFFLICFSVSFIVLDTPFPFCVLFLADEKWLLKLLSGSWV